MALEVNGRLEPSNACGQSAWSKLPRSIWRVWRLANGRLERPSNRWPWRQTAGLNALTTNACGQSAWSKLPWSILGVGRPGCLGAAGQSAWSQLARSILGVWRLANGRLERPNNRWLWRQTAGLNALTTRCLWPECLVEAAAKHFRGLKARKRQASTL